MSIFFTSDTHFSHKNIIEYENRPFSGIEEMDAYMIWRWNEKVKPTDSVYILGDFIFGKGADANKILRKLNGNKHLIKGNHDHFLKDGNFNKSLFNWVKDYYVLKYNKMKFILFHYPIQVWDCQHYGAIHLYGHIHSNQGEHVMEYDLPNSYNVGVDVNGYEPVSMEEILNKLSY